MASAFQEALVEAGNQYRREGYVWETLRRISSELDRLKVPYVTVGAMALQHYGIRRSTEDVDLLVDKSGIEMIHQRLVNHGYVLKSPGSRHLRDEVTRVRVEFLVAGEFPGDGKPKPVAFPSPHSVAVSSEDGILFVNLPKLIELKLASAKSAAHRIKDRADVLDLIHRRGLSGDFANQLDPYVQNEFRELAALPPPSEPDRDDGS